MKIKDLKEQTNLTELDNLLKELLELRHQIGTIKATIHINILRNGCKDKNGTETLELLAEALGFNLKQATNETND